MPWVCFPQLQKINSIPALLLSYAMTLSFMNLCGWLFFFYFALPFLRREKEKETRWLFHTSWIFSLTARLIKQAYTLYSGCRFRCSMIVLSKMDNFLAISKHYSPSPFLEPNQWHNQIPRLDDNFFCCPVIVFFPVYYYSKARIWRIQALNMSYLQEMILHVYRVPPKEEKW